MADLKACLPSGREDTVAQEDMPGTTTTIVTSAMTRPTVMEKIIAKESKINEEWPEEDNDSDKEMEMEMIKLQIEIETEKVERLKRVELKPIEDDQNFLQKVAIIKKREENLSEAKKKTEEARRKVREDDEEWLREALMLEEPEPTPTSPAPSPNLPAKMPIGKEPC